MCHKLDNLSLASIDLSKLQHLMLILLKILSANFVYLIQTPPRADNKTLFNSICLHFKLMEILSKILSLLTLIWLH